MESRRKRAIKVTLVLALVIILIASIYVVLSDSEDSKLYGTWNYTYFYDDNLYDVRLTFYTNGSCYVINTNHKYSPEWSSWKLSKGDLWNEYKDVYIIHFDPWLSLPTPRDTEDYWGTAVSKVGIDPLDEMFFLMILPSGDTYPFIMIEKLKE